MLGRAPLRFSPSPIRKSSGTSNWAPSSKNTPYASRFFNAESSSPIDPAVCRSSGVSTLGVLRSFSKIGARTATSLGYSCTFSWLVTVTARRIAAGARRRPSGGVSSTDPFAALAIKRTKSLAVSLPLRSVSTARTHSVERASLLFSLPSFGPQTLAKSAARPSSPLSRHVRDHRPPIALLVETSQITSSRMSTEDQVSA